MYEYPNNGDVRSSTGDDMVNTPRIAFASLFICLIPGVSLHPVFD